MAKNSGGGGRSGRSGGKVGGGGSSADANTVNLASTYTNEGNLFQYEGNRPPKYVPPKTKKSITSSTPKVTGKKVTIDGKTYTVGQIVTGGRGYRYRVNKYGGFERI